MQNEERDTQFETNEKSKTYVVDEKGKRINEECRYKKVQTDEFRLRGQKFKVCERFFGHFPMLLYVISYI